MVTIDKKREQDTISKLDKTQGSTGDQTAANTKSPTLKKKDTEFNVKEETKQSAASRQIDQQESDDDSHQQSIAEFLQPDP